MTDINSNTPNVLDIRAGDRVQVIRSLELATIVGGLPEGVVISAMPKPSPNVGIMAVEDENDLRERLFTELAGLRGADHVWILSRTDGSGPDETAIQEEAKVVSWSAAQAISLADGWIAVELTFAA